MAAFSDSLEVALINATLRGTTYVGGLVYIAAFTGDPTDAGNGPEVSDSGYARQVAGNPASSGFEVPDPTGGETSNSNIISFPAIVDAPVDVTHWAVFDAATGGEMRYHGVLANIKMLDVTDVLAFPKGSLVITLD